VAAVAVPVAVGQTRTVLIELDADLASYTGRAGRRHVEPGEVTLRVGASSTDIRAALQFTLTGPLREVGANRELHPAITVLP
jgi:beta-xylosidase